MKKIALLTNDLFPYRVPVYRAIAERFDLKILISGVEDNRHWQLGATASTLDVRRSWGFTFKRDVKDAAGIVIDVRYFHINPGFAKDLIKLRPDAVISTEMGFRTLVAIGYARAFRKPQWTWWGGTRHTSRNISRSKRVIRRLVFARLVDRWISYGSSSTDYLISLGVPNEKIVQIQNGVDEQLFGCESDAKRKEGTVEPRVLFVGQLLARKGIYEFLHAVSNVQARGNKFSTLIVGDGPERDAVVSLAKELRLEKVSFVHRAPYSEMSSIYNTSDLLVFPTLEDVWGLVVNEAVLANMDVIASKYAGCASELLPRDHIFDPLDPDTFATMFEAGVSRKLSPIDKTTVWPIGGSANLIIESIYDRIGRS